MKRTAIVRGVVSVITVLICISSALFLYSKVIQKELRENTTRTLSEIAQQGAAIVNGEMEAELRLLTEVSDKVTHSGTEFHIDRIMNELTGDVKNYKFKAMGLIQKDGQVLNTNGAFYKISDVHTRYAQVFRGETMISDQISDRADGGQIVLYSVPLYLNGEVVAALVATYDVEDFKNLLSIETFGGDGYSYVVKENGDRIVVATHPKSFGEFENIFDEIEKADPGNGAMSDELRNGLSKKTADNQRQSGHITFFNKELKYMQYTPLNVNDWYLLTTIPTRVVDKSANHIMTRTITVCFVIVGLLFLLMVHYVHIRRKSKEKYDHMLYVDPVTDGASYEKFVLEARAKLGTSSRRTAFIILELVNLGLIYEKYGNEKGDEVLRYVHRALEETTHPTTISARVNANEFVVLSNYDARDDLVIRMQKFVDRITILPENILKGVILQPALGIYMVEGEIKDIIRMRNLATIAKNSIGKNHEKLYAFYDDLYRDTLLHKEQIAEGMVWGMRKDEFIPYFQPKYDTITQRIIGAEALVRWIQADGTIVQPNDFIPIAEENGFVVQIDKMMFKKVCRKQRELLDQGIEPVPISVNLSRKVLHDAAFLDEYQKIMRDYNISKDLVELELTESTVFSNNDDFINITTQMHKRGFKILVDDFGMGYSSLMMLKSTWVDAIKLDKSFIDDYQDAKGSKIVTSVIALSKKLQIPITVEGVETQEQYEFLRDMECDVIQGYYFAKPMKFEDFRDRLTGNTKLKEHEQTLV